jgi:molybdopterin-binding protein
MKLSARNQFPGKVVGVKTGAIMAEVTIEVNGPITVVAEITKDSTERLGLAAGDDVTAIIKATEVLVGK